MSISRIALMRLSQLQAPPQPRNPTWWGHPEVSQLIWSHQPSRLPLPAVKTHRKHRHTAWWGKKYQNTQFKQTNKKILEGQSNTSSRKSEQQRCRNVTEASQPPDTAPAPRGFALPLPGAEDPCSSESSSLCPSPGCSICPSSPEDEIAGGDSKPGWTGLGAVRGFEGDDL